MWRNDINPATPLMMHIDLNSCFATIEQQSRPLLRHRPVAVVNRRTKHTAVVTASYEAKARGVKVGMRLRDAAILCPDIVALESDPAKYRYVYHKLIAIMQEYSPQFQMKSIDEGVINFSVTSRTIRERGVEAIAREIKQRLKDEVGCYMRCNIGIAPNRFLAKTAAGMNKPDGLTIIDNHNLREQLAKLELEDLTGIAHRLAKRLRQVGITTPLEFLDADATTLESIVFHSICGRQWHQRLRGWEVDDTVSELQNVGRQYVLDTKNLSYDAVLRRLHGLSEDVAAKLRAQHVWARGVRIYARGNKEKWKAHRLVSQPFNNEAALFDIVKQLSKTMPLPTIEIGVTCYHLSPSPAPQATLFYEQDEKNEALTASIDNINAFFGAHTIHSADTLEINRLMKRKIPFGSTRYL